MVLDRFAISIYVSISIFISISVLELWIGLDWIGLNGLSFPVSGI